MSEIVVRYFAAAADVTGLDEEVVAFQPGMTLGTLQATLITRYGAAMQQVLRAGSFLVDGRAKTDRSAPVGRVVDVLPPFAGG